MSASLSLRDYQRECIEAVVKAWLDGIRRPAVVIPTGAGKTVVFSFLILAFLRKHPGRRVIVLVHRDELADQAMAKIRAVAPHLRVGKVKAQDNDVHADVMVCSVQTVSRPSRLVGVTAAQHAYGPVGLMITDECQHAAALSYGKVYEAFPDALHAGFTATLERGDGVGLGSVWDDVVFTRSPLWMMKHGYLVEPRAYTEDMSGLDLDTVRRSGGDYQSGDLGRALEESDVAAQLPGVWKEHAAGRPTIVFTPTVATAHLTADAFAGSGVASAVVSGETPREERLRIFDDFRTGRVTVLSNCMVLTEGFDAPWASCAVIARPTRSRSLYVQMVGRVLRPWKGKEDAVVLNLAGGGGQISTLVDLEPGAVLAPREGEGLLEAQEREQQEYEENVTASTPAARALKMRLRESDSLFASSSQAWLTTAGGVMFLSVGEWTVFLWPGKDGGGWDVCRKPKHGRWVRTEHRGLDLSMAMAWAEAEAEDCGSFSVARSASWRRGKPSEAQLGFASNLGIDGSGMTKPELSDAISVVVESRALDPFVGVV